MLLEMYYDVDLWALAVNSRRCLAVVLSGLFTKQFLGSVFFVVYNMFCKSVSQVGSKYIKTRITVSSSE